MSSVEANLVGVWSCLYCDGVWLPSAQAGRLISPHPTAASESALAAATDHAGRAVDGLCCPACRSTHFRETGEGHHAWFACTDCSSLYLPKPTVEALGTRLGGQWHLGGLFGWLLTGRPVQAADGLITVGTLIYLLLSS